MPKAPVVIAPLEPTTVRRIWIDEGCIACGWCGDLLPTVFTRGTDGKSQILGLIRRDKTTDDNGTALSPLRQPIVEQEAEFLAFVAAGCPPHVINLE